MVSVARYWTPDGWKPRVHLDVYGDAPKRHNLILIKVTTSAGSPYYDAVTIRGPHNASLNSASTVPGTLQLHRSEISESGTCIPHVSAPKGF